MKIISNLKNFKGKQRISLAIGLFDGVHLGHQKIISENNLYAKENKILHAVLTFRKRFRQSDNYNMITTFSHRLKLIKKMGCNTFFIPDMQDLWFFSLSGEEFIKEVLKKRINCVAVFVGMDFRFGKDRLAYIKDFEKDFVKYGIDLKLVNLEKLENKKISSSTIKEYLRLGDFERASKMLGREYSFGGNVIEGNKVGEKIGVRTANIDLEGGRLPMEGVFLCEITGEDKAFQNRRIKGILSIGSNPSVSKVCNQKAEVHIFDFEGNLYGKFLEVFPKEKIRDIKKFNSIDELKKAILDDINIALKRCSKYIS